MRIRRDEMAARNILDLVQDARRGNLKSFNELVLMYQDIVYDIAHRMLSDQRTAETATQEAFLSAYRSLSTYRGSSFRAWLLRILIQVCHNELRFHKTPSFTSIIKQYFSGTEGSKLPTRVFHSGKGNESTSEYPDLNLEIQNSLASLPADERVILVLVAIWVVNPRLTRSITSEIERAQNDLAQAKTQIAASRAELQALSAQIEVFQAFLDTLGKDAVENTRLLAEVVARVEGNITPVLEDLSGGVDRVREGFESIKETIARLNNLPLVSICLPGETTLQAIADSLADLQGQIGETKARVESISQVTQDTVEALTSGFETWEDSIAKNQALLDEI